MLNPIYKEREKKERKKFLGTIFVPLEVFRYNFCTIRKK